MVARQAHNLEVACSSPASATNILLCRSNTAHWRISQFIEGTKVEISLPSRMWNLILCTSKNEKKMNPKSKTSLNFEELLNWTYPRRVTTPSADYVTFKAKDPETGKLKEKRYSLLKWRAGQERETMASQLLVNILSKLQQNWNPFVPDMEDRSSTLLDEVIEDFKAAVDAEVKKKIKKDKTRVDYFSRLKMFHRWAKQHKVVLISHCTSAVVDNYLQSNLVVKGNSARTRNNNRTFLSAFFGWCVKRHYLRVNPCSSIENVREGRKLRTPLSPLEMQRLKDYLLQNDKPFLLAVMMQYYTLIRPKEMSHLKLRDFSLKEQTVIVPEDISKNHREEPVALNDRIIRLMLELHVFDSPGNYYLFGRDFHPSMKYANERIFRERWIKIREELHLPYSKKFYSLKDTGIIDLIATEGAVNARDQARHTSIAVTNLYTRGGGKRVHEETKHFKGNL